MEEREGCREFVELISPYVEGELSREEARQVAGHLEACPGCRGDLELLKMTVTALRGLPQEQPGPEILAGVRQALRRRPSWLSRWESWTLAAWPRALAQVAAAVIVVTSIILVQQRYPGLQHEAGRLTMPRLVPPSPEVRPPAVKEEAARPPAEAGRLAVPSSEPAAPPPSPPEEQAPPVWGEPMEREAATIRTYARPAPAAQEEKAAPPPATLSRPAGESTSDVSDSRRGHGEAADAVRGLPVSGESIQPAAPREAEPAARVATTPRASARPDRETAISDKDTGKGYDRAADAAGGIRRDQEAARPAAPREAEPASKAAAPPRTTAPMEDRKEMKSRQAAREMPVQSAQTKREGKTAAKKEPAGPSYPEKLRYATLEEADEVIFVQAPADYDYLAYLRGNVKRMGGDIRAVGPLDKGARKRLVDLVGPGTERDGRGSSISLTLPPERLDNLLRLLAPKSPLSVLARETVKRRRQQGGLQGTVTIHIWQPPLPVPPLPIPAKKR